MTHFKDFLPIAFLVLAPIYGFAQCADSANIYSFYYDGHSYEMVKENKTWTAAVACAISRNGYLAEINDEDEQNAIFNELTNNANITNSNTQNQFGTASVWLGGSDAVTEGDWIWDGDNDGQGPQFWSGASGGNPVGGLYTNWGISPAEPDNSGGQDHLTMIIKSTATNFSLWNDLVSTNSIYYLIEHNSVISLPESHLKKSVRVYPNPFQNFITIENSTAIGISKIEIYDLSSLRVKSVTPKEMTNDEIDLSYLEKGIYLLYVHFENGEISSQKIVK